MGWLNLPNSLTLARVAVIPIVMLLMHFDSPVSARAAAALFIVASVTDVIDGYLARRYNITSVFGAFLDPLADKLIVMAILVTLIPLDRIPSWIVVLLLARELAITGLRGIASTQGMVIAASKWGKYKTAYQMTGLSFLLIHFETFGVDCHMVGTWLIGIATIASLYSGIDYMVSFVRYSRQADPA